MNKGKNDTVYYVVEGGEGGEASAHPTYKQALAHAKVKAEQWAIESEYGYSTADICTSLARVTATFNDVKFTVDKVGNDERDM